MLWLYITILSYLLFAGANIFDRYILRGPVQHPLSYAFYIGASGIFATVLIPFGFRIPEPRVIVLAILAGASVIVALYYFFKGIYEGNVSTQVPMVGALSPLSTLFFGFILAGEKISITIPGVLALFFLILGIIFLSAKIKLHHLSFKKQDIINAFASALFFGPGFILTRIVYETETFINGYIWTTWGGVILASLFLLVPLTRDTIFKKSPLTKKTVLLPLIGGKSLGMLGNVAQNYAVSIAAFGQVAFISALAGVQHLAILVMAVILFFIKPDILEEEFTKGLIAVRFAGVLFVGIGIYLLIT